MPLTISKVSQEDVGLGERIVADVTFDASYPTGGEDITAADLGFRVGAKLDAISAAPGAPAADGIVGRYIPDASLADRGKLQAIVVSSGLEVANAVDLSSHTLRVVAEGR